MKLSDAGRKVWDRPYHHDRTEIGYGERIDVHEGGVPFGWVAAKDVLAALKTDLHDCNADELAHDAIYQAIALCNALAEEGL